MSPFGGNKLINQVSTRMINSKYFFLPPLYGAGEPLAVR